MKCRFQRSRGWIGDLGEDRGQPNRSEHCYLICRRNTVPAETQMHKNSKRQISPLTTPCSSNPFPNKIHLPYKWVVLLAFFRII